MIEQLEEPKCASDGWFEASGVESGSYITYIDTVKKKRCRPKLRWVAYRQAPPVYLVMGDRSDFLGLQGILSGLTQTAASALVAWAR